VRSLHGVVTGNFLLGQPEEPGSVVVKNVTLLRLGQKGCFLDRLNRRLDDSRPDHLVGAEHDAITISGLNNALEVSVEGRPRLRVDDAADVDVHLRMSE